MDAPGGDDSTAQASTSSLLPEATMSAQVQHDAPVHEIRFCSLFREGRALAFPCDAEGHVDLDALSPQALGNYLYARAMVGREFTTPTVRECLPH
jgi:hypothetical protein